MSEEINLSCHAGSITARIGDRFGWWDKTEWEIVSFTSERIYSPSGFAGTPIIKCRHLDGVLDGAMKQYTDAAGLCEWCGDSVASALYRDFRGNRKASPTDGAPADPPKVRTPQTPENNNG